MPLELQRRAGREYDVRKAVKEMGVGKGRKKSSKNYANVAFADLITMCRLVFEVHYRGSVREVFDCGGLLLYLETLLKMLSERKQIRIEIGIARCKS